MPQTKSQEDVVDTFTGSAAGGDLSGTYPNPTIGASKVITTSLKTAQGEVSTATIYANLTLPGGEYGFYPQIKASSTISGDASFVSILSVARANQHFGGATVTTSYATRITIGTPGATTIYAQQRYVTTSGIDLWLFLHIDKNTKNILSAWQAPDHPSYGNGGDADLLAHPFGSYDKVKHEIVIIDKETCSKLRTESVSLGKSILTLVNERYKLNSDQEEIYKPLHSGKFMDGIPVIINTIPNYIKVRKLRSNNA